MLEISLLEIPIFLKRYRTDLAHLAEWYKVLRAHSNIDCLISFTILLIMEDKPITKLLLLF